MTIIAAFVYIGIRLAPVISQELRRQMLDYLVAVFAFARSHADVRIGMVNPRIGAPAGI